MKSISRKIGLVFLAAVIFAGMLTACATSPASTTAREISTPTSFVITDQLGQNVTITNNHPVRIISAAPSNTEILFALGLGNRVVGVTDYSDYPPEAKTKPSIGAYNKPNIEAIVAKDPDLVLGTESQSDDFRQQLRSKGITVVTLSPRNLDQVMASITLVGKITGQVKEAAGLVNNIQQRIKAVTDKTDKLAAAQRLRVFYVIWNDPIWTAGGGTFEDELIQKAGGINIAHDLDFYKTISLETVIAANPQVMIAGVGMGTGEDAPLQFLCNEPRLAGTDARMNNRVCNADMDIVARPGPRIVDALETFFHLIHPEM